MTKEVWKDIEGYEGKYQVSDSGRVKSLNYRRSKKEKVIKSWKRKDGYLQVVLCKDGENKNYLVHRLVAQNFIPNSENLPEVNHKDEDKSNNAVNNLEWCDCSYNINYGTKKERGAKSQGKPVMCVETNTVYFSTREAQRKTGIHATNISACARNEKYYHTARRYHWKFIDKEDKNYGNKTRSNQYSTKYDSQ